ALEWQLHDPHVLGRPGSELLRIQRDGPGRSRRGPYGDGLHVPGREGQPEPRNPAHRAGRRLPMGGPATGEAPMRISRWTALWLGVIAVLVAVEIGVFTGFMTPAGLISWFLPVLVGLVCSSSLPVID